MSTNSRIGKQYENGTIRSIYCHWDGHLDTAGKTLLNNYRTANKIDQLLDLGDLSVLGKDIGVKHNFDTHKGNQTCNAYGRDRGEDDVAAKESDNLGEFESLGGEFFYVWVEKEKKWYWFEPGEEMLELTAHYCR